MNAADSSPDGFAGGAQAPLAPEAYLVTGPVPVPWSRGWNGGDRFEPATASDAELAVAACGDSRAFAVIYDRYSTRLFDYCAGMLRDRDAAADCVQDTFATIATRLPQLREPDRLRPWLYAIARNEAHRKLKARRREQPSDELPDSVSPEPGPEAHVQQTELAELVAAAGLGLSGRERDVLELHYRHGLDGPELAAALGLTATNANTIIGRARTTIERSLGALLLARRSRAGGESCPELDEVLGAWDGVFSVLWRKRIARHIERCPACQTHQHTMVNPRSLLGSVPVLLPAPLWLRHQTLTHATPLLHHGAPASVGGASWWPHTRSVITPLRAAVAAPLLAVPAVVALLLTSQPVPSAELIAQPAVAAPAPDEGGGAPRFGYDMPTTVYRAPTTTSQPGGALVVPSSSAAPLLPRGPAPAPKKRPIHTPLDSRTAPTPRPDGGISLTPTPPPPETTPATSTPG